MGKYRHFDINALVLDDGNPRFLEQMGQDELLKKMATDPKVRSLAKHITLHGQNPTDLPCVLPFKGRRFVVKEGNRRVAALKLLDQPSLAGDGRQSATYRKLVEDAAVVEIPKSVFAYVADSEEEAAIWIRLKHAGEQGGAGTVQWAGWQTALFDLRTGGKSKNRHVVQLLTTALKNGWIEPDAIGKVKITNLARVLDNRAAREALRFSVDDGLLHSSLPDRELKPLVERLVRDASPGGKSVREIYTDTQIADYAGELIEELDLASAKPGKARPMEKHAAAAAKSARRASRDEPDAAARRYLIPRSFQLAVRENRINAIYLELKKHVPVQKAPNAVAVLFRVFVELSVMHYLKSKNIPVDEMAKLKDKIKKTCVQIRKDGALEEKELTTIEKAMDNDHNILSAHTFNQFAHNKLMRAIPSELNIMWDRVTPFMRALWD